jgi:hypothetical protein
MIIPHPESDLKTNVLVLGSNVLKSLKGKGYVFIDDVANDFFENTEDCSPEMFMRIIILLFSLGLIEYTGYKVRSIIDKIK